jgi:hypothetical protein
MLSRRTVIMAGLAASAGFHSIARARNPPAGGPDGNTPPGAILRLQRRNIVVNGKPASVYGIRQPDGTFGITTDVGKPFRIRVENGIDEPSLIHWHGLTPPWQQDGVPGISGPPIPPGGTADYDFPLRFGGTFWMHSHQGLQEQLLMAAPLIIHDQRDRPDQQEIVVTLADFSFTPPDQIFAELKKSGSKAQPAAQAGPPPVATKASMGGMAKMGASAKPDLNDVKYDAFLANDRTLADPEVIKVEPGGRVLLRIINSSSMSAYHIDLSPLDGELVAVRRVCSRTRERPQFSDRGCAAARHSPSDPADASVSRGSRGAGRRSQTDRRHTSRRKRAGGAYPGSGQGALDGPHARSGRPPPRTTTADPAQGRPRSHDKPDRRYGEIHMVAQQRPLDPERPAIADRQWRTGRAGDSQSDWNAAPDASTWSRVPGCRDRRQALLGR